MASWDGGEKEREGKRKNERAEKCGGLTRSITIVMNVYSGA